ncbi:uncharacterized protein PAC_16551 [Phialocephala subalpina]|uniref:Major facilitator superfamily (MFS) profile domain-containing protein n=1 Tax=Phialocephala subalpina TaxID=576137 RepID=A0A1L7XNL1_9HELO|nr:uncharacterized protein PAC_16551 [Phialocephala subalpina]
MSFAATFTTSPESSASITELGPLPEPSHPSSKPHSCEVFEPETSNGSNELIRGRNVSLSKERAAVVVGTVAGINFLNTMGSWILTVALPTMARSVGLSVGLSGELLLWPASIYALTCGCTLLLAGSIADILGKRPTFLTGTFLYAAFTLGCALSSTGADLIIFRGLQGVNINLCLTTAVGIVSTSFPSEEKMGNRRNVAFAATGAASPVGYTVGLVLGGVFFSVAGWRVSKKCNLSTRLMAIINLDWSFWTAGFVAVFLSPMSSDVLYAISNLIITATFPSSKQSLAGGVFNAVSQIGNSVGLTVGAVIAASVSASSKDPGSPDGLEKVFRATFWACFAALGVVAITSRERTALLGDAE